MPAVLQPRLIRYRDAPSYCGVGRRVFDRDIRPWMVVIPIGKEGVAFDRLDLDAWIEQHKSCSGRPPEKGESWDAQERREFSPTRMETKLSTRSTTAGESSAGHLPSPRVPQIRLPRRNLWSGQAAQVARGGRLGGGAAALCRNARPDSLLRSPDAGNRPLCSESHRCP